MDFEQVIKRVYDPVEKALRITYSGAPVALSKSLDGRQIVKRIYDPATEALRVTDSGGPSEDPSVPLDFAQVLRRILDEAEGRLNIVT